MHQIRLACSRSGCSQAGEPLTSNWEDIKIDTLVVTTVHEEQIVYEDELPLSLLEPHDLPVDLIITPKRIINVKEKLSKPSQGVLWNTITPEMMQAIPFLEELRRPKIK